MADNEDDKDVVPRSRLNQKNARISELEAELREAKAIAGDAENWKSKAEKWESKYRDEVAAHKTTKHEGTINLSLIDAGIRDADDQELARWRWSKADQDRFGGDFTKWMGAENGARSDKHLAGFFAGSSEDDNADKKPATKARLPKDDKARGPRPPDQRSARERFAEAKQEFLQSDRGPEARAKWAQAMKERAES